MQRVYVQVQFDVANNIRLSNSRPSGIQADAGGIHKRRLRLTHLKPLGPVYSFQPQPKHLPLVRQPLATATNLPSRPPRPHTAPVTRAVSHCQSSSLSVPVRLESACDIPAVSSSSSSTQLSPSFKLTGHSPSITHPSPTCHRPLTGLSTRGSSSPAAAAAASAGLMPEASYCA